MTTSLAWGDWLSLFLHFATLSLLSIGGAIATVPDMHRFLHDEQQWLSELQFSSSIALAQAAPGPNVLFVALLGWQVGLNAGGGVAAGWQAWPLALAGVVVSMVAILLPSSLLTYGATRWVHRHQQLLWVRAFKQGLAPVVVALMLATGWLLSTPAVNTHPMTALPAWLGQQPWFAWALSLAVALLVWRTRLHLLWCLGAGAGLGALGWI
jgi:chromate transporter